MREKTEGLIMVKEYIFFFLINDVQFSFYIIWCVLVAKK